MKRSPFAHPLSAMPALLLLLCAGCSWFPHRQANKTAEPAPAAAVLTEPEIAEATAAARDSQAASTVVLDFYEMHQRLGNSGLPKADSVNAYRAFLCPGLGDLIVDAQQRQQRHVAAHPDDKPPLVEGDLFSSLFEGPDSVTPGGAEIDGDNARVSLSMRSGEGEKATRWKDTAVLTRTDGVWCIDDVEYHGPWPFANKGRLSDILKADF